MEILDLENASKWWLITWSTYASWLPGDPRGFCTLRRREYIPPPARFAASCEPIYDPSAYQDRYRTAQQVSEKPVVLSFDQQQLVLESLIEEIEQIGVVSAIMAVSAKHCHWLALFDQLSIRATVGRLKAAATRSLNRSGFDSKRPWTKGCNMKSKKDDTAFRNAFCYVYDHRDEGSRVYVWPNFVNCLNDILLKP